MAKHVKLTEEQRKMVNDNLAFATYVAKKYFAKNDYLKNQDIIQEAVYAMSKAMPKYDADKAKLTTYMYPTIDGHLKRFVRYKDRLVPIPHQKHLKEETKAKAEKAKFILSLDKKYSDNEDQENCTLMNILPSNSNVAQEVVDKISVTDAVKNLEWREKIVIIYRFYFDLNQTYIGKLMSISQVHVHRLEKRALKNMRRFLS